MAVRVVVLGVVVVQDVVVVVVMVVHAVGLAHRVVEVRVAFVLAVLVGVGGGGARRSAVTLRRDDGHLRRQHHLLLLRHAAAVQAAGVVTERTGAVSFHVFGWLQVVLFQSRLLLRIRFVVLIPLLLDLLFLVLVHFSERQEVFDEKHDVDAAQSRQTFPHAVQVFLVFIVEVMMSLHIHPGDVVVVMVSSLRVWYEMQEGVAAQRADGQRHQEAEEELEENPVHERDEDDSGQRQQADDRDGHEPADPRCRDVSATFSTFSTAVVVVRVVVVTMVIVSMFMMFVVSVSVFGGVSVQDARSAVNLVEEGGTEEAEVTEGHVHFLRHPV